MKRIFLLALGIISLTIVSCQKQEIVPIADKSTDTPVWEKALNDDEDNNGDPTIGHGNDGGNGITDPNNDPDGNKK